MKNQILLEQLLDAYDGDVRRIGTDLKNLQAHRHDLQVPARDFSDAPVVVDVQSLTKTYKLGRTRVEAVKDVSLQVRQGEIVALTGTSGSGKSTVLQLIGGLDKPTSGSVLIDGLDLRKMRDGKLSRYRGQKIGFVFQSFYLQPFLSVRDNIEVPAMFARIKPRVRHDRSQKVAAAVGLNDRLTHYSKELSGGQIQRTAIARALINQPKLLLADEPTGNLDQQNATAIFDLFEKAREEFGTTVIVVTHDDDLAHRADRIIRLTDGRVAV